MTNSTINVLFRADLKAFSTAVANANRSLRKYGTQLTNTGKSLSLGLTAPILAFGAVSLKTFNTQAQAVAQLNAGLESTGNQVGYTSEELQKMASDLQNNSLFGDEEILQGATAQLLTFTNIAGEQFARTQVAALDLATRLDGDLKSASISLGKALNSPVENLSALSRSGIQFSEDQKAMIKSLVETNRLADAQTLILDELSAQYGGSSAAAAEAGTGGLTQLANILGDVTEDFGKIINEALKPFIAKIKEWAIAFQSLSPEIKKVIAIVVGLAAAIGPVLVALGFLMTSVIPGLITAFAALSGPVGLLVAALAAVAVVIYKNWGSIKQVLVNTANYFVDLYNESVVFRIAVESIILVFKNMWATVKFVFSAIWSVVKAVGRNIATQFELLGDIIKAALTFDVDGMKAAFSNFADNIGDDIGKVIDDLSADFNDLAIGVGDNFKDAIEGVGNRAKIKLLADNVDTSEVEKKVSSVVSGGGTNSRPKSTAITGSATPLFEIPNINDDVKLAKDTTDEIIEGWQGSVSVGMAGIAEGFAEGFGSLVSGFIDGSASMADVGGLLLTTIADIATQLGKAAIEIGTTALAIKLAFTSPFATIAAGVALVALGTVIGNAASITESAGSTTAFANGGIVYGPTNALIGEYAGASSNPEVVAPLDKLQNLIAPASSSQAVNVGLNGSFKLSGQDMLLMVERATKAKSRNG